MALGSPAPQSTTPGPQLFHRSGRLEPGSGDPLEDEIRSRLGQLVGRGDSRDVSSSDEECAQRQRDKLRPKDTEGQPKRDKGSGAAERANGQEAKRGGRAGRSAPARDEGQERRPETGGQSLEERLAEQEQRRGDRTEGNRVSKRQHKRDSEKEEVRRSGSCAGSPAVTPSAQEGAQSNNQVSWGLSFHPPLSSLSVCCSTFSFI